MIQSSNAFDYLFISLVSLIWCIFHFLLQNFKMHRIHRISPKQVFVYNELIRNSSSEARTIRPRPSHMIDEIIRVDHAGEMGADRIYAGQMAILGNSKVGPTVKHMWEQEIGHRKEFEKLIQEYRVRPTVMMPLWNVAGFVLGAGTALMGEKAAMACTVAVETVIVEHYNEQLRQIIDSPDVDKVRNSNISL